MKGLLFCELGNEFKRSANISVSEVIFALNFFERHAAGQAASHHSNGQASTSDYRFAVTDIWVDDDAVWGSHGYIWQALMMTARLPQTGRKSKQ